MDIPDTTQPSFTRPDMDIEADVQQAISALNAANTHGLRVKVKVSQGQVTLTGYLRSEMIAPAIAQAVRAVHGASSVVSHLMDDSSLVRRLSTALASDARTRTVPAGYQVVSSFGRILVVGDFASASRAAISQVCASVPGVRSVEIRSVGNPPQAHGWSDVAECSAMR